MMNRNSLTMHATEDAVVGMSDPTSPVSLDRIGLHKLMVLKKVVRQLLLLKEIGLGTSAIWVQRLATS